MPFVYLKYIRKLTLRENPANNLIPVRRVLIVRGVFLVAQRARRSARRTRRTSFLGSLCVRFLVKTVLRFFVAQRARRSARKTPRFSPYLCAIPLRASCNYLRGCNSYTEDTKARTKNTKVFSLFACRLVKKVRNGYWNEQLSGRGGGAGTVAATVDGVLMVSPGEALPGSGRKQTAGGRK